MNRQMVLGSFAVITAVISGVTNPFGIQSHQTDSGWRTSMSRLETPRPTEAIASMPLGQNRAQRRAELSDLIRGRAKLPTDIQIRSLGYFRERGVEHLQLRCKQYRGRKKRG